jgi:hypothetical protein
MAERCRDAFQGGRDHDQSLRRRYQRRLPGMYAVRGQLSLFL